MRLKSFVNEDLRGQKIGTFGILGIINIRKENFLAIVTDREQVGQIRNGADVFEVTGVRLEPFNPMSPDQVGLHDLKTELEKFVSTTGFYFSYTADLTLSL